MNRVFGILAMAAMCASLPAPIIERGGQAPDIRHFSDEQLNQQMGSANSMGEVGEVELDSTREHAPSGPLEEGSSNISSASSKLVTRKGDTETLLAAETDLRNAAKYRWWSTPLYAGLISLFTFAFVLGFRTLADKKIGGPGRTSGNRRPR